MEVAWFCVSSFVSTVCSMKRTDLFLSLLCLSFFPVAGKGNLGLFFPGDRLPAQIIFKYQWEAALMTFSSCIFHFCDHIRRHGKAYWSLPSIVSGVQADSQQRCDIPRTECSQYRNNLDLTEVLSILWLKVRYHRFIAILQCDGKAQRESYWRMSRRWFPDALWLPCCHPETGYEVTGELPWNFWVQQFWCRYPFV